jgi:hypothetical protein
MDRVPADSFSPKYMTNSMLQNAPDTYIIRNPHRITLLRKRTYNPHRMTFLAKKAGGDPPCLHFLLDIDTLIFYDCYVVSTH